MTTASALVKSKAGGKEFELAKGLVDYEVLSNLFLVNKYDAAEFRRILVRHQARGKPWIGGKNVV